MTRPLEFTTDDVGTTLTGKVNAVITGADVEVLVLRPDKTTLEKDATITDGPTGAWSITWAAGDLNVPGTYYVTARVTFAGGAIEGFSRSPDESRSRFSVRAPNA